MSETEFTLEQFLIDAKNFDNPVNKEGVFKLKKCELFYFIEDKTELIARAYPITSSQYGIEISKGMLSVIYDYTVKNYQGYYEKNKSILGMTKNSFLRMVCNLIGEMTFWHEFSHICRNHFLFLDEHKESPKKALKRRAVEMDADIYGASILLARILSIPEKVLPLNVTICVYTIALRGLFEVLNLHFPPPLDYKNNEYPHPHARAFCAFSCAVTSPLMESIDNDLKNQIQAEGFINFIRFEHNHLKNMFNIESVMHMNNSDLDLWDSERKKIDKNQILAFNRRTLSEKVATYIRLLKTKLN